MKNRLPTGNCPYCDAERGITTAWGMSPEGWGAIKDAHDAGHHNFEKYQEQYKPSLPKCVTPDGAHQWSSNFTTDSSFRFTCQICRLKQ